MLLKKWHLLYVYMYGQKWEHVGPYYWPTKYRTFGNVNERGNMYWKLKTCTAGQRYILEQYMYPRMGGS